MRAGWIVLGFVGLAACVNVKQHEGMHAVAIVRPAGDNAAVGEVTFVERSNGKVLVVANLSGLKPYSEHGFHIHETGDCARDGANTGGHFNPAKAAHGHLGVNGRHAGDLPNLRTDARGRASTSIEIKGLSVGSSPASVIGRSVVVHALPDDYRTDPSGNAGPAIGCGVIEKG